MYEEKLQEEPDEHKHKLDERLQTTARKHEKEIEALRAELEEQQKTLELLEEELKVTRSGKSYDARQFPVDSPEQTFINSPLVQCTGGDCL